MAVASDLIISSDSHVMEPPDLWKKGVPEKFREDAPLFPPHKVGEGFQKHAGGWDPHARMKEMEADGLSAEVLYPTLMLDLFALDDAALQEACFRVYNDWLIDYCSANTDRLIGIPAIPVYNAASRPPVQFESLRKILVCLRGSGSASKPAHSYRP